MQTEQKIINLVGIRYPLIQAPMAGVDTPGMAAAVSKAGGLGSLACAILSPKQIGEAWRVMRQETDAPINLNFFCHEMKDDSATQQEKWLQELLPYYKEFGIDPDHIPTSAIRAPFDDSFCQVVEEIRPPVVSFHFGLPDKGLLDRVKATGAVILSSATTVDEAIWLEKHGCDVVIAQGVEAGGHRGMFLTSDIGTQTGTEALVKQVVEAVSIPVVAAGGIADVNGIRSALSFGAAAVQLGTAYLFCPEANVSPLYRKELEGGSETVLTNVFSGRPARGIANRFIREVGPFSECSPNFPYAAHLVNPLRKASESISKADFMQMWSGTVRKPHRVGAGELTRALCEGVWGAF
jgi:nitronate monooxygenase